MVIIRVLFTTILFLTCLLFYSHAYSGVGADVNRKNLTTEDTLQFYIYTDDLNTTASPDFSILSDNFILGQDAQMQQTVNENGQHIDLKLWIINLTPKKAGNITIPSFTLNNEKTAPINITVLKPQKSDDDAPDLFIETSIDKTEVYVQSMLVMTIKIHKSSNISSISPNLSDQTNAIILPLNYLNKSNAYSDKYINGKYYVIEEHKIAIFPQQSGIFTTPELTIRARQQSKSRFSRGNIKHYVSDTHTVNVLPIPPTYPNTNWLPANNLVLKDDMASDLSKIEVNTPINRKVTIVAQGLASQQLPILEFKNSENFKIYLDKPQINMRATTSGVLSESAVSMTIIPTKTGEIELPEISLTWWDTDENSVKVATIPSRVINVIPGTAVNSRLRIFDKDNSLKEDFNVSDPVAIQKTTPWLWIGICIGLAVFWIVTFILWWNTQQKLNKLLNSTVTKKPNSNEQTENQLFNQLINCCQNNSIELFRSSLLKWANAYWKNYTILSINDCMKIAESKLEKNHFLDFKNIINKYESNLYQAGNHQFNFADLIPFLKQLRQTKKIKSATPDKFLPKLYPSN